MNETVIVEQHTNKIEEDEHAKKLFHADQKYLDKKARILATWKNACEQTGIDPKGVFIFPQNTEKHEWWTDYEEAKEDFVSYTKQMIINIANSEQTILELIGIKAEQK